MQPCSKRSATQQEVGLGWGAGVWAKKEGGLGKERGGIWAKNEGAGQRKRRVWAKTEIDRAASLGNSVVDA